MTTPEMRVWAMDIQFSMDHRELPTGDTKEEQNEHFQHYFLQVYHNGPHWRGPNPWKESEKFKSCPACMKLRADASRREAV